MYKNWILIISLPLTFLLSQEYEDVVVLKNGTTIHGIIIEQSPGNYIKIQSGKNIFVYEMSEIDVIKKEPTINNGKKTIKDKTWSLQAGFGTRRNFNLLELSKDFKISNNTSFYITAGLGATLLAGGFSFSTDYNESGLCFSTNFGITTQALPSLNGSLLYQLRLADRAFLSFGAMAGVYSIYWDDWDAYYDYRTAVPYILPVLAFDIRF